MMTAIANVSRDVGRLLLIPAGMALLTLPVCAIAREWFAIFPFIAMLLGAIGLSVVLQKLGSHGAQSKSSQRQILIVVGLGWAMVAALGALPIWLTALVMGDQAPPTMAYFTNGLNALFEGMSGFTSAGLTMAIRPSQLPACLQWWRSLMQWVGGVGVIVLAVALLEPTKDQYVLYQAEGRQTRIRLTMTRTVRRIVAIYAGYTAVSILALYLAGMSAWEAVNHGMAAVSTGGFSITDDSMGGYSAVIKLLLIVVMVIGAISFNMHDQMFAAKTQWKTFRVLWHDHQHSLLLSLLGVGTVIVGLEHYQSVGQFAWVDSGFQWVSALTTCGFASQSIQLWNSTNKLLLSIAMFFGGAAGSTAGGIKLKRVLELSEAVSWRLRRTTLSSRQIVLREINRQRLNPAQASRRIEDAAAIVVLWVLGIAAGVLVLLQIVPAEYTLSDVVFESSAALGTAGLSVGITSPSLHWLGKSALIVLMWMGRLEIIPVLVLLVAPWEYAVSRWRSRR